MPRQIAGKLVAAFAAKCRYIRKCGSAKTHQFSWHACRCGERDTEDSLEMLRGVLRVLRPGGKGRVCACVCVINVWDYKTKQLAQLYEYVMLCGGTPARFVSTYCFGSISPTCFLSTHCFVGTTPARIVSTHCSCCSL